MLVTLAVSSLGSVLTATILGRRLRKIVADAVKQVEQDANERLAQELALQSYYSGGTRLHRRNADDLMLGSGKAIASEIGGCFEGIREVGRGIVYFGSARFEPGTPLYEKAKDLARRLAATLQCPSWSGGGKGIMGAVTHGAKAAGQKVGAVRISREASDVPGKAPPGKNPLHDTTVFCQFMASRKIGLTDAGMRVQESDKTAVVVMPGGIGTLDEAMEILVLGQLNKMGTNYPVPVLLVNYDSFYDGILNWLESAEKAGALSRKELSSLKVVSTNDEAVEYLAKFYGVAPKP